MAAKSGFHIELIPNMYDLGLFKKSLQSRKRLRLTTLAAVILLCALFGGIGCFIRYISGWFWINVLLIIFVYICVLIVALLLALTIGDVVFAGPWREKMARGAKYMPDDVNEQKALLKNKNIYFILIWGISIVVLGFGCDLVTGGNIRWYQSVGSSITMLKSDDPHDRVVLMRSLANVYYSDTWKKEDVRDVIIGCLDDSDEEVRTLAAYICGKAKYTDAVDGLIKMVRNADESEVTRGEAAIALGRMEWKPARPVLISTLRDEMAHHPEHTNLVPSIFYAFYEMKDSALSQDVIRILSVCLDEKNCSEEVYQYAFFYLKSLKNSETSETAFKYVESDMPQSIKCYAVDSLRFASKKTDIPRMKELFDQIPSDVTCPVIYRKYHEEAAVVLFEEDPMRALLVRAIGNYMVPENYDWIWMVGSNTAENPSTRKVAEIYTRAMIDKGLLK